MRLICAGGAMLPNAWRDPFPHEEAGHPTGAERPPVAGRTGASCNRRRRCSRPRLACEAGCVGASDSYPVTGSAGVQDSSESFGHAHYACRAGKCNIKTVTVYRWLASMGCGAAQSAWAVDVREGSMRHKLLLPFTPRFIIYTGSIILSAVLAILVFTEPARLPYLAIFLGVFFGLAVLGTVDLIQTRHAVLRNYPISAHLRFLLEHIRPEMRQYFFEDEKQGQPFSRDKRAIVYQRAKNVLDKRPFGTQYDVYADGYEWLHHSIAPQRPAVEPFRVMIGRPDCTKPYSASVFNISAMSFGALSPNAIRALNGGARQGGFAHDTGEGGFSPYHREMGGDIIWEIGSGYFGCRNGNGMFCPDTFTKTAASDQIKMIEVKLSQGAKPGHGGVLPAAKVSPEIAQTRGVPMGQDCISPSSHSAFTTPLEFVSFIAELRRRSGGKPTGFKLCVGHPWEFLAICKAMLETGHYPDFIVVDGKEGGTGAAPLEFLDHLGMPLRDGLTFVHNALVGIGARDRIRIGASGKIISAFDIARAMALGADWCNSAPGLIFALGCIQFH